MKEAIINVIVTNCFEIVASVISIIVATVIIPWLRSTLVPFLVEKRLYNIVAVGVQAAEKLASSHQIDKKDKKAYVVRYLTEKGIAVTPEIETVIESVCHELDMIVQETYGAFNVLESHEGETVE